MSGKTRLIPKYFLNPKSITDASEDHVDFRLILH